MKSAILPLVLPMLIITSTGCSETTAPVSTPATNQVAAPAPTKEAPAKGRAPKLGTTDVGQY